MHIKVGARASKLSLAQTGLVTDALLKLDPTLEIELQTITTKGDTDQSPIPLDTVGKSWFTSEIEEALGNGEIDLAIHSLKDLPPDSPERFLVIPVLAREDAGDVLVSKRGELLANLPQGATVGTDSTRRKAQIHELRPDIIVKSIRGNVDTRLRKLQEEDYDAIVIAAAGLARLGLMSAATERLDPTVFTPAPGQGALAAQIRAEDAALAAVLERIEDPATRVAVDAERAFSRAVDGGCKLPVGCFARVDGEGIELFGMVAHGGTVVRRSVRGNAVDALALAAQLAGMFEA